MDSTTFKTLIYDMAGDQYGRVEVADNVFNNHIIPICIHYYVEKHYDGAKRYVYRLPLVAGQTEYTLPSNISCVTGIMKSTALVPVPFRTMIFNRNPEVFVNYDMISYSMFSAFVEEAQITFGYYYDFEFSKATKKFTIFNPETQVELYLTCYTDESISNIATIREDPIFQKLCCGHVLVFWARSIKKYDRKLVGGATLNWQAIEQDGKDLIQEVRDEIENDYSEQPEILIG